MNFIRFLFIFIVLQAFVITVTSQVAVAVSVPLDSASSECLGCHKSEGPGAIHKGEGQTVHIVGKDYALSRAADPTLTPAGELNSLLTLVQGKVACVTCHTVYSKATHPKVATGDSMLSISNDGSALCLACHRK